jgi:hypothetical protein
MKQLVTCNFVIIFIMYILWVCTDTHVAEVDLQFQQSLDSIAEHRIDSAYTAIQQQCDSLQKNSVPKLVDSLLQQDSIK